ncbi:MAG: M48 family metallopeptidase [Acidimicrobiales bacterium]|jgi:predicted metal-dependent hydrolase
MTLPFHHQPELLPSDGGYLAPETIEDAPVSTAAPGRPEVPDRPEIEVRHSTRRRKTAAARWEGDRVVVLAPNWLRGAELDQMVEHLVGRMLKQRPNLHASDQFLTDRAADLSDRYLGGVRPASIRWSSRQHMRWGSCTVTTREIRIAERLRPVPAWVLDSVIVHELAHLIEYEHSARFRELEARYPRLHDANIFLAGYSMGLRREEAPEP